MNITNQNADEEMVPSINNTQYIEQHEEVATIFLSYFASGLRNNQNEL